MLVGLFLSWLLSRTNKKIRFIRFFIWAIPFSIYFTINPIYDGDFANNYRTLNTSILPEKVKAKLLVVAIPGCPFCMGSTETLKELKKRNKNLEIQFLVCNSDKNSVSEYKQQVGNSIKVTNTRKPNEWANLAQGKFPSFVLIGKREIKVWSNDGFGVRAKDEIETTSSN